MVHTQTKNQVSKQSCEVEKGFKSRKIFKLGIQTPMKADENDPKY